VIVRHRGIHQFLRPCYPPVGQEGDADLARPMGLKLQAESNDQQYSAQIVRLAGPAFYLDQRTY
jgi:hypothetical protein